MLKHKGHLRIQEQLFKVNKLHILNKITFYKNRYRYFKEYFKYTEKNPQITSKGLIVAPPAAQVEAVKRAIHSPAVQLKAQIVIYLTINVRDVEKI